MVHELIQRGWAAQQAGYLASAKTLYEQALKIEPRHPDALNLLGVLALQSGDPIRAVTLIGKAIEVQPANPGFHANLAQAYLDSHRIVDAHGAFRRAAKLDPRNPQFAVGAAVCLALQGNAAEAEERLRAVVAKHPRYALAWYNLGNVLRDAGRAQEAADSYRQAIRLDPALADPYNDLGRLLHQAHRFDEAEQAYRTYLGLQPHAATGYVNLASLLIDLGRPADAAQLCREAIARLPAGSAADLHWMLGSALAHEGDLASALVAHQAAVAAAPGNAHALWGYGLALRENGKAREGLRCLERAREMEPDSKEFRQAMAGVYLSLGDLNSGWREYRHRPARIAFVEKFPHVDLATEAGASLQGRRILLVREQGLGDEIFFLRFAPRLKSRGATITYRASAKIASVLARVQALDQVITDSDPWPAADLVVLVGDLPGLLGVPDASPYHPPLAARTAGREYQSLPRVFFPVLPPPLALEALPQKRRDMRERLSGLGPPPYLGLTWRAGTAPERQGAVWLLHKETPLELLGAAVRGVNGTLLALQRNPQRGEIDELSARAARPVHDLTALNEDLEGMLALLTLADEYIGVSNTNMHLRAGAARVARVLMPRPAEWRWFHAGDESPWFPGFRVYRQGTDGEWNAACDRLERDLRARYGSRE